MGALILSGRYLAYSMSHKLKYTLYSLLILATSAIYFTLAYIGFADMNINIDDVTKLSDTVIEIGVTNRKSGKYSSKVCYFRLSSIDQTLGVYRATKNYTDILNSVRSGSAVTVYYQPNTSENINIDVLQLDYRDGTLYEYEEYEKKGIALIIIGLIAGIGTVIGAAFYYKKFALLR